MWFHSEGLLYVRVAKGTCRETITREIRIEINQPTHKISRDLYWYIRMSKIIGITEILASVAAALYFIFRRLVQVSFPDASGWFTFSIVLSALLVAYLSITRKLQRCSVVQYLVVLAIFAASNYGQWQYLAGCGGLGAAD